MGLRQLFRRQRAPTIHVHLVIRGRIGDAWCDVDEKLVLPKGTTLAGLIAHADRRGLGVTAALDASPHLRHSLMWNGERAEVATHSDREVADGDQLYLLAPLAGG